MRTLYVLIIILFTGCKHDEPELIPKAPITDTVSYSAEIVPIMTTYCWGIGNQMCHVTNTNQGAVGDFTNYAGLKEKVDNGSINSRVFSSLGGMPPSYSNSPVILNTTDLQKLQAWVAIGAPEN